MSFGFIKRLGIESLKGKRLANTERNNILSGKNFFYLSFHRESLIVIRKK